LQAQFETSVCLIDATGKSWAASLKANESKNFDGVPPWRVFGADLPNIQVFYQGQLMRVQNQSVILKEAPGSFSGLLPSGSTQPASR
jgi:hypothetical protein